MNLNQTVYRLQLRLHYDREEERELIEKIENRNRILQQSINDYVKHAIYAFEDTGAGKKEMPDWWESAPGNPSKNMEESTVKNTVMEEIEGKAPVGKDLTGLLENEDF